MYCGLRLSVACVCCTLSCPLSRKSYGSGCLGPRWEEAPVYGFTSQLHVGVRPFLKHACCSCSTGSDWGGGLVPRRGLCFRRGVSKRFLVCQVHHWNSQLKPSHSAPFLSELGERGGLWTWPQVRGRRAWVLAEGCSSQRKEREGCIAKPPSVLLCGTPC